MQNWQLGNKIIKKIGWLVVAAAILCFYFAPYFKTGLPTTHDSSNHVARFAAYYQALKEGQFPPRLAGSFVNNFTYPVFNYNYPLANLVSLPFSLLKVHYEITFKLLIVGSVIFGLIGVFKWLSPLIKNRYLSALTVLVFLFNPYLVSAIFARGSIGEVFAMCILPWCFYFLNQRKTWGLILTLALLILSHNVLFLFGVAAIFLFAILNKKVIFFGQTFLIALLLTSWFWLPAFAEKNLVVLDNAGLSNDYALHFITWPQLFTNNFDIGLSNLGSVDGLGLGLGWIFWLIIAMSFFAIIFKKKVLPTNQQNSAAFITIFFITLFLIWLQTKSSQFLWQLPLMNFLQFPWRLASLAQILSLFLLANLLSTNNQTINLRKILIGGIITLLALTLIINYPLRLREYYHFSRDYWLTYPESSSTNNENLPTTFTYDWQSHLANKSPQIISENNNFDLNTINTNVQKWTGSEHLYVLSFPANTDQQVLTIIEDTANYPGWETKINNQKIDYVDDASIGGRLAFNLTPDTENITVKTHFTGYTLLRRSSEIISLLTLIGCVIMIAKRKSLKQ